MRWPIRRRSTPSQLETLFPSVDGRVGERNADESDHGDLA
jgi:hypothetical protein